MGTKWEVVTLNQEVDDELNMLDAALKAKFLHIAEMLESFGPEHVKEPYCKPLGNKLWEIRMKGRAGIARAIYVTLKHKKLLFCMLLSKKHKKHQKKRLIPHYAV